MAVVSTGLNLPGARSEFFNLFDARDKVALYNELATLIKSNKDIERYRWLGALPTMKLWGTGREAQPVCKERFDVENAKYELTLEIDRDEISDDQTGQIMQRIKQLAVRAAQHKDALLATLLANGAAAANLSYDGVPFFSANHDSGVAGVQSNILTPSALDTANPTVPEFKTAMKQAIAKLLNLLDDQGEPMNNDATGLVVITTADLYITALEALSATVTDASTNVLAGAAKVVAWPRLSDVSKFFLCKTNGPMRPFVFQDREPIEFKALEGESETGFMRELFIYGVRARYMMAYGSWQNALSIDFT